MSHLQEGPIVEQDKKRELRQLKREIKRKGSKVARRQLKRGLEENPEDAHEAVVDYGRYSSEPLNGLDRQQTWHGDAPVTPETGRPKSEKETLQEFKELLQKSIRRNF